MENNRHPNILHAILSFLLCFALLFLLTACSDKKEENKSGIVKIKPQIIFSQNGITVTANRYELSDNTLWLYATADNKSSEDVRSFMGCAYIGGVGTYSYMNVKDLTAGKKGVECDLMINIDKLSIYGVSKDMIGGEIPLFLKVIDSDTSEEIYDTRTITLPAAEAELPSMETEGLRMFTYSGEKWDYALSYIGEQKNENGGLDLYISIINRSDKALTPTIWFCGINGMELSKEQYLSIPIIGPESRGVGVLKLSAEDCAACGIDCFDDIEYLSYTATGILRSFTEPSHMLEYRESDAHPVNEPVNTDRGAIRVYAAKVDEAQVSLEVRVDMTTIPSNDSMGSLISDIETMTFVNGCGEKSSLSRITATIDGNDLCYTGTMGVYNVDDNLSLCFLVIGDDVWLLG